MPPGSPFAAGGYPYAMATGDFNGDGILDLATVISSGEITLLLGNGAGTFKLPSVTTVSSKTVISVALAVGDFNGDSIQDIATANSDGTISVLLGNGSGGFRSAPGRRIF